ncbi:MAG: 3'(2'),5'-bisphosphate nucleotidase CysQ [Bacteroidota bacterium]
MELEKLLSTVKLAAKVAGEKILEVYHSGDFDVAAKSDDSPLTRADKQAHEAISEILQSTDLPILSEEGRDIPFTERSQWEYFWMVDPLDGTKEFIKRNGEFTVNIALIHRGRSILGVVLAPVLGKCYYAYENGGAFVEIDDKSKPIKANSFSMTDQGLKVVASRSHLNDDTKNFMAQLDTPEIVSMGSSLKFMVVAEGGAELYPRFAPTMEWDTAAAQIIVEEAGGAVLRDSGSKPVLYNKENLLNPHFLCSAKV